MEAFFLNFRTSQELDVDLIAKLSLPGLHDPLIFLLVLVDDQGLLMVLFHAEVLGSLQLHRMLAFIVVDFARLELLKSEQVGSFVCFALVLADVPHF